MHAPTLPFADTTQFRPTEAGSTLPEAGDALPPGSVTSTLSPSLLLDLQRFSDQPGGAELLPAIAASVRHARPLALHLQHGRGVLRLSVFPRDQLFHCPLDLAAMSHADMARLRLLHLEPEGLFAPLAPDGSPASTLAFGALAPLLWRLALHGSRSELLPEIAGSVRYRLSPVMALSGLPVERCDMPLLQHLRQGSSTLDELTGWAVLGAARVRRLLNALYLQSGLIISRAFVLPPQDAAAARPPH